jgi:hypothetical protein
LQSNAGVMDSGNFYAGQSVYDPVKDRQVSVQ